MSSPPAERRAAPFVLTNAGITSLRLTVPGAPAGVVFVLRPGESIELDPIRFAVSVAASG